MTKVRTDLKEWHAWVWIVVGFLAGFIVLVLATQMAGAPPAEDDEPAVAYIVSSWDGVFYAGRYFGDKPFVEAGMNVEPTTVVGTIEGMRRFQQHSGANGTIVEVLVADGVMVYMGQPLFEIQLAPEPKTP